MATSFHPELTSDSRLHAYFLDMVSESAGSSSPK
jgi:glutamine amidotransferase PdxT